MIYSGPWICDRTALGEGARGTAAGLAGDTLQRRGSPDLAKLGRPGVKSIGARVREALCGMGNPPEHSVRWIRAQVGLATARGGSGSPANCVNAVPASREVYWL